MQPATEPGDPEVTARKQQVALAGHTGDAERARAGLSDPAGAVRAAALGALARCGELAEAELSAGLHDPDPAVRTRAAEVAAGYPGVDLVPLLDDGDPMAVEMTAWALGERRDASAVDRLIRLSAVGEGGHRDPLVREAAVAALGAIGDVSGLPAVLDALDDKPAIRRRAAVALAAFEGPEVDAALERCLADRDWQVRQVAEDLLAPG